METRKHVVLGPYAEIRAFSEVVTMLQGEESVHLENRLDLDIVEYDLKGKIACVAISLGGIPLVKFYPGEFVLEVLPEHSSIFSMLNEILPVELIDIDHNYVVEASNGMRVAYRRTYVYPMWTIADVAYNYYGRTIVVK